MEDVKATAAKPEQTEEEKQISAQATAFRERLKKEHLVIRAQLPLKVGVHEDLYTRYPDVPKVVVDKALKWLVNDRGYTAKIKVGAARVDLDGNDVGEVTAADAGRFERKRAEKDLNVQKAAKFREEFAAKKPGQALDVKPSPLEAYGELSAGTMPVTLQINDFDKLQGLKTAGRDGVRVRITLQGGSQIAARLNAQSFRKAVDTFKAAKGQARVEIIGNFVPAEAEIMQAGLRIVVKGKAETN